jgi:hypothetical protein
MGESPQAPDGENVPLASPGIIHLHLHVGSGDAATREVSRKPFGGWAGLIGGVALMAAFAGGYRFAHRSSPDDVSNLRPMPAFGSLVSPGAAVPGAEGGLPAIERQLATPPQIIPPTRGAPQPVPAPSAPGALPSSRNPFGLEN